jgi:hypothetical protein
MTMTATQSLGAAERDLLVQLTERWGGRVAVKRDELDLDGHFDPELPDFPAHLVPVLQLPHRPVRDPEAAHRILSAAWIAYNYKTSAVEEEIILPACEVMLSDRLPGRRDDVARTALRQTIIDEHYHILMCMNAAGVARRRRGLDDLRFPSDTWHVVRTLREFRAGVAADQADLVTLGFALAAETTINAFLLTVSVDADIQPLNRITVDLHRQDESGHAVVFRELCAEVYRGFDTPGRELFTEALRAGLAAFRTPDHRPWTAVAAAGGEPITVDELVEAAAALPPLPRDSGPLRRLLTDLDLVDEFAL